MIRSMYFDSIENDKLSYLRSSYFPRVVVCVIHSREDAVNPVVEVPYQCVLPTNFLNEKIFIGLWVRLSCNSVLICIPLNSFFPLTRLGFA